MGKEQTLGDRLYEQAQRKAKERERAALATRGDWHCAACGAQFRWDELHHCDDEEAS